MKLSLVITIKNEAKSIPTLLQSIEAQSKLPDEVVIVDAGSTDQTVQLIKRFQKRSKLKIRLFYKQGNRAVGRNFAVNKAVGQGIAVTDAGCVLDKHWLKRITAPLSKVDAVAGFYRMNTNTLFTQCSAPFVGITSHNLSKDFLPSSRSLAFTKTAWVKVGGYPEDLDYAEDLIFARKFRRLGMYFEPQAIVYWTPPRNLSEFFTAIKNYTRGNIQACYWPHLYKNYLVAIRYVLFPITLILLPVYFLYTTVKFRHHLRHPLAPNLLFVLQLTADMAVIVGLFQGVYDSLVSARPRPSRN